MNRVCYFDSIYAEVLCSSQTLYLGIQIVSFNSQPIYRYWDLS